VVASAGVSVEVAPPSVDVGAAGTAFVVGEGGGSSAGVASRPSFDTPYIAPTAATATDATVTCLARVATERRLHRLTTSPS